MRKPSGVIAMLTIMIFMVVLLSIGSSIALLGQDQISLAGTFSDGEQAFAVADACSEEGYNRLLLNASTTSTSFGLNGGTCSLTISTIGSDTPSIKNRLIIGTGTYRNDTRVVNVNLTIKSNGSLNANKVKINSWKEGT